MELLGSVEVAFLSQGVVVVMYKNGLLAGFDGKESSQSLWQTRETFDEDNKGKFKNLHRYEETFYLGGFLDQLSS